MMDDLTSRSPLHRYSFAHTAVPDVARHALIDVLGAHDVDLAEQSDNFQFCGGILRFRKLDLIFGGCTAATRKKYAPVAKVRQQFALRGTGQTKFGSSHFNVSDRETGVIPAGVETYHENGDGSAQLVLRIDTDALQSTMSAMNGLPVVRAIEFRANSNFNHPELQRLRRMLEFIVSELDRDDGNVSGPALEEFEQLLIVSFLTANRHNFSHQLEARQPKPAPWQVRVIEDYIDANWNQPITVTVLSAAAGASARSIFKAFKDARGCSPMAFVKSVRLNRARHMLTTPTPDTSVVGVAFACGFLNPGHFSRDYRLAFGELPSATLGQSKSKRD